MPDRRLVRILYVKLSNQQEYIRHNPQAFALQFPSMNKTRISPQHPCHPFVHPSCARRSQPVLSNSPDMQDVIANKSIPSAYFCLFIISAKMHTNGRSERLVRFNLAYLTDNSTMSHRDQHMHILSNQLTRTMPFFIPSTHSQRHTSCCK